MIKTEYPLDTVQYLHHDCLGTTENVGILCPAMCGSFTL